MKIVMLIVGLFVGSCMTLTVKSGLKLDSQAKYCWDNPIAAGKN